MQQETRSGVKTKIQRANPENLNRKKKKRNNKKKGKTVVEEEVNELTEKEEEIRAAQEQNEGLKEVIFIPYNLIQALMTGIKKHIRFIGMNLKLRTHDPPPDPN